MRPMLGVVEIDANGVRCTDPGIRVESYGVRVERSASSFELSRVQPSARAVYYRVDCGRLEWGGDLAAFLPDSGRPVPDAGMLLGLIRGHAAAPDTAAVPGVRRLAVGTTVRVNSVGVTVTRRRPILPERSGGVVEAVGQALGSVGKEYAIAYSGGLSSAFLAVSALTAGHRPVLLHADLGPAFQRLPVAAIPGLEVERVRVDLHELLDHDGITGDELIPPLPDTEVPRRMAARLAGDAGLPLVSGGLLEDLVSARLPDVNAGARGWRLLGCEPFHIAGTLSTLAEARRLLGKGLVSSSGPGSGPDVPDAQPVGAPPPPSPIGGGDLPGLTEEGRRGFESAHRGAMAVWREHLDFLGPVLGRVVAGLEERGDGGVALPALDSRVLAAVAALPPSKLARIRRGAFCDHLPLHRALAAHGVTGVRRASSAFWLRLAAAAHLHREREKVVAQLERECALADLGLIEPEAIMNSLRDGRDLTDHALPLLRLVWVDRWLRGRS